MKNDGGGIYVKNGGSLCRNDATNDYGSSMKHS